jgi:hypothetical protein
MLIEDLSPEVKEEFTESVSAYDTYLRGVFRNLARLARKSDPSHWKTFAQVYVDPVLEQLDPTETIPNSTDLAQAKPLTVKEFKQLQTIARQLTVLIATNRLLLVKAIGAPNVE